MSIIETIREKGAVIVIAVIAISLIGFILMDSMSGTGKLFGGGNETTLGIINGQEVNYFDFNQKVQEMEAQFGNQSSQRNQIMQGAWDQIVAEKIVNEQFEKLGLVFTAKEMSSIMFSDDAPPQLKQAFTDPNTGVYDIEQAKQWWTQVKAQRNKEQQNAIVSQVIDPMILNTLYGKYTAMISASVYQPGWMTEMNKKNESRFAVINYVAIPYSTIGDSTLKITDQEIKDYVKAHKEAFKQEPGVMLSYVAFSAAPSSADSQRVLNTIEELKAPFEADTNAKFFLGRNSSSVPFFDGYVAGSKMNMPYKDEIIALPLGGVYGPYLDGKNYVLAKKVETRVLPDSFKVRHILLGTINPQTQQPLLPDTTAKRLADSIATAIQHGADFNELEQKYSTDEAAKQTNGVMVFDLQTIQGDNFAREFGKFLLNDKGETKKVVETQFGYHYIEIIEKMHPETAYKIAYMAREIDPSDETINNANSEAVKLSASGSSLKSFNDYVTKNGLAKIDYPFEIKENDYQLGSYPDARSVIKWAFESREGSVSEPFSVGSDFLVVAVDKKLKEGTMDVQTARPQVESILLNKKKAKEIKNKIGNANSLETIAQTFNTEVLETGEDSSLTFNSMIINGIGNEPKVAGASFNKEYQTKISPAIPGNTGVFVIKVKQVGEKPITAETFEQQQKMLHDQQVQTTLQQSFSGLRKIADIKDYRSKFY